MSHRRGPMSPRRRCVSLCDPSPRRFEGDRRGSMGRGMSHEATRDVASGDTGCRFLRRNACDTERRGVSPPCRLMGHLAPGLSLPRAVGRDFRPGIVGDSRGSKETSQRSRGDTPCRVAVTCRRHHETHEATSRVASRARMRQRMSLRCDIHRFSGDIAPFLMRHYGSCTASRRPRSWSSCSAAFA
jgi:hypothetical protein